MLRIMLDSIPGLLAHLAWLFLSTPGPATTQPAAGIDESRAFLRLNEIQPVPVLAVERPTPKHDPVSQAQRELKRAAERYDAQLWAESAAACERALQFDPGLNDARIL